MKKDALAVRFRKGLRQWAAVLPFITVGLVLFVTFVLYPQIKNIYIAFTDYSIMPGAETPFVGFANFQRAFEGMFERGTDAYYFWISFRNNILAVLITVPGQLVLGLLVAVMIHNLKFGKNIYKSMFYIAVICDWVVVANILIISSSPMTAAWSTTSCCSCTSSRNPLPGCKRPGPATLSSGCSAFGRALAGL